jgi:hypothetical protein
MVRLRIKTVRALEHYAANTRDALVCIAAGAVDEWAPHKRPRRSPRIAVARA